MPQIARQGAYHVPVNFNQGGFYALSETIDGQPRHVAVYVMDTKADKHVIETTWPAQEGRRHTGITIDEDQFGPLYKQFGHDFVIAYNQLRLNSVWIELEYEAKELPSQYFSADVSSRNFAQVVTVKVGASIGFHNTSGFHVFINHGPY
jgi:hypothetical protein